MNLVFFKNYNKITKPKIKRSGNELFHYHFLLFNINSKVILFEMND